MKMSMTIIGMTLAAALTACGGSGSEFVGSPHGYSGQVSTIWADVQGLPTIRPGDTEQIIGTRNPDGIEQDAISTYQDPTGRNATGLAARLMAKGFLCATAPQAPECGGGSE